MFGFSKSSPSALPNQECDWTSFALCTSSTKTTDPGAPLENSLATFGSVLVLLKPLQ